MAPESAPPPPKHTRVELVWTPFLEKFFRSVYVLLAVGVCLLFAGGSLLQCLTQDACGSRLQACSVNLREIHHAMQSYFNTNGGYYPWCGSRNATDSLALLYPAWLDDASVLRCPSMEESDGKSDYGYDTELPNSRAAGPHLPIVADMPGNHPDGRAHVLYADGSVGFVESAYVGTQPADNIYVRDPAIAPRADAWMRQP